MARSSGYGEDGPWVDLPGQDLLAQARSGLLWLTGSAGDPPMPMGLAAADMMAGNALAQGVLAALVAQGAHRSRAGWCRPALWRRCWISSSRC